MITQVHVRILVFSFFFLLFLCKSTIFVFTLALDIFLWLLSLQFWSVRFAYILGLKKKILKCFWPFHFAYNFQFVLVLFTLSVFFVLFTLWLFRFIHTSGCFRAVHTFVIFWSCSHNITFCLLFTFLVCFVNCLHF